MTLSLGDPSTEFQRLHLQREIGSGSGRFDNARAAIVDWAAGRYLDGFEQWRPDGKS